MDDGGVIIIWGQVIDCFIFIGLVVWSGWYEVGKLYIYMGTESVVDTPYNKATGPQEDKKRKQKKKKDGSM